MKIRKGDNIVMLSGKDKGKKGKVKIALGSKGKVLVEGLNLIRKHLKARQQNQKGQIIQKERSVSVSSVALICRSCSKQTRIGYKIDGELKIRICKKCGAET